MEQFVVILKHGIAVGFPRIGLWVALHSMPSSHTAPRSLPDLSAGELGAWMEARGCKASHALRVLRWLYAGDGEAVRSRARMPAGLAELMRATFSPEAASLARRQVSDDGT